MVICNAMGSCILASICPFIFVVQHTRDLQQFNWAWCCALWACVVWNKTQSHRSSKTEKKNNNRKRVMNVFKKRLPKPRTYWAINVALCLCVCFFLLTHCALYICLYYLTSSVNLIRIEIRSHWLSIHYYLHSMNFLIICVSMAFCFDKMLHPREAKQSKWWQTIHFSRCRCNT